MPRRSPFPAFPVHPLPPDPPPEWAAAPRPWLDRAVGQCAFPIDGDDWLTRACCNPCDGSGYCPDHRALMLRPEN